MLFCHCSIFRLDTCCCKSYLRFPLLGYTNTIFPVSPCGTALCYAHSSLCPWVTFKAAGSPQHFVSQQVSQQSKPAAHNFTSCYSGPVQHTTCLLHTLGHRQENRFVCTDCHETASLCIPIQQKMLYFLVQITIQASLQIKHVPPFLVTLMVQKLTALILCPKHTAFPILTFSHIRIDYSCPLNHQMHKHASDKPLRPPHCEFTCLPTGRTMLQVSNPTFDNLIQMGTLRYLSYLFSYTNYFSQHHKHTSVQPQRLAQLKEPPETAPDQQSGKQTVAAPVATGAGITASSSALCKIHHYHRVLPLPAPHRFCIFLPLLPWSRLATLCVLPNEHMTQILSLQHYRDPFQSGPWRFYATIEPQ